MTKPKARSDLFARIPAGFVRSVLRGHGALGLAFAALIYVVCLSGSLAVFADEFRHWESASAPDVTSVDSGAIQRALEEATGRAGPGLEHVYIMLPSDDLPQLRVQTDAKEDRTFLADQSGNLIEGASFAWTDFLLDLHITLHLPQTWGVFLVGLVGVALLSSLISGILAHPRILRDAFHLRLGGSRRLQEADLHNRLGVWALPFHLIIALTGALLGLTTIIVGVLGMAMFNGDSGKVYELFFPKTPAEDARAAPVLDLRPMMARLPSDIGKLESVFIEHPTEMGAAALFNVRRPDRLAGVDGFTFDRDGRLIEHIDSSANNLGGDVLNSLGVLHFGWYGGLLVKLAYLLLGFGLTYLTASGVQIWLARRRDKGRPAPRWESLWAASVWGQPAGLAAAASLAIASRNTTAAIAAWLFVIILFAIAAFVTERRHVALTGQIIISVLLILTVVVQFARAGLTAIASAAPLFLNVVFAVTAVIMLGRILRASISRSGATSAG